jgi:hypothetical protein
MANRLISVGDDFTLPPAVKVADKNLPPRLSEGELNTTIAFEGAKRFIEAAMLQGPGIDPTGATESSAAVQEKINAAGGKPVYVGPGTYLCTGLTVPSGTTVIAFGAATFKTPAAGGTIMNLTGSNNVKVKGLTFRGSLADDTARGLTGAGATTEIGIRLNKTHTSIIDDCKFVGLNYAGIHVASTGNVVSTARFDGDSNRIVNCHAENCFYGFDFDTRGEYVTVGNCVVQLNYTGIRVKGGNNLFTGCQVNRNRLGLYVANATNSGHGSAVACAFNHNDSISVQVDEQANGFIFTGCQFFTAKLVFNLCSGVIITASEFSCTIQISGGGWNTINNSLALGTTSVVHNFNAVTDATVVSITKLDGTVLT